MKKLFILLSLVLIPSLLFAWIEPTGSTYTVSGAESQEVKDIVNDNYNFSTHAFVVETSTPSFINIVNGVLESSGVVKNFPTDYPDSTSASAIGDVLDQLKSSATVSDVRYSNKVSTGTYGKITAATTATITITKNVASFHFTFVNSADGSAEATVVPTLTGSAMYFYDGFFKNIDVKIPQPITFICTMPVTSTMTYEINEVVQP
jgi:hypothetical protein